MKARHDAEVLLDGIALPGFEGFGQPLDGLLAQQLAFALSLSPDGAGRLSCDPDCGTDPRPPGQKPPGLSLAVWLSRRRRGVRLPAGTLAGPARFLGKFAGILQTDG